MARDQHPTDGVVQGRSSARRVHSRLDRSWGHGFLTVRTKHLVVLGISAATLLAMTGPGVGAAPYGHRATGGGSLHGSAVARNDLSSSWFSSNHPHHFHPLPPPTWTPPATTTTTSTTTTTTTTTTTLPSNGGGSSTPYPYGTPDSSEPSGMSPPAADAMSGYTQSYENDFTGSSLPSGWEVFTGNPGGDPGAQWGASHVTVGNGMLQLNTFQDPAYGNEWVAGGLCQCGVAHTYGAYYVRSKVTGAGPTQVELLWPQAQVWLQRDSRHDDPDHGDCPLGLRQ
jgi:hypothetical protein